MAMVTKIKHFDQLKNGVLRFRRRFHQDVAQVIGQEFLQVHIRERSGLPFQREYDAILREFDRVVREARASAAGNDTCSPITRSPITRYHKVLLKAEGLVAETEGLEDDSTFARHMLAKGLSERKGADPLLIKALFNPEALAPKVTVKDASNLWRRAWQEVISFFAFSPEIRRVIYTTNAMESLNRVIRKSIKTRGSFPSEDAAEKLIYLAFRGQEKTARSVRGWRTAVNQFAIMFEDRFLPMSG